VIVIDDENCLWVGNDSFHPSVNHGSPAQEI
jgi:hypothetical protein